MTVAGYTLGSLLGVYFARQDERPWRDILEAITVICLSAVLGAKVFHTLFEARGHVLPDGRIAQGLWDLLKVDPWHWARLFEPGYVFYGGVAGAVGVGLLYAWRTNFLDIGKAMDNAAAPFAFGIAVGRIGCFLAGCCYGHTTDLPWAVSYPAGHPSHGALVHPVQLYDVVYGLVTLALIFAFYKKRRFPGEVFVLTIASYAVWRFISEIFRGDGDRGLWLGGLLSTSQIVSLVTFPIAMGWWWWRLQQSRAAAPAEESPQEEA